MNILLVVTDVLRRDHMGCYGCGKNTTLEISNTAKRSATLSLMISDHLFVPRMIRSDHP